MDRLQRIVQHISAAGPSKGPGLEAMPTSSTMSDTAKSPDDVVICSALRTPIAKARRGNFKDMACEDLLAPLFKETMQRSKIDPKLIGDIQIGNASQPGAGAITARMGQFLGGVPFEVPLVTVNRQCSSGLQAVANIASSIKAGIIDVGIAGGVESMSLYSMTEGVDFNKLSPGILENEMAGSCLMPMGLTSENVAAQWGISRETQDAMAAESHRRAVEAQKNGLFDSEIVPVAAKVKDAKGNVKEVVVKQDEGPRAGTTAQSLGAL